MRSMAKIQNALNGSEVDRGPSVCCSPTGTQFVTATAKKIFMICKQDIKNGRERLFTFYLAESVAFLFNLGEFTFF